jgi:hypothetical protein
VTTASLLTSPATGITSSSGMPSRRPSWPARCSPARVRTPQAGQDPLSGPMPRTCLLTSSCLTCLRPSWSRWLC